MASVSDAELKKMTQEERVTALGMRTEQLTGKSLYIEFDPDATERFTYPWAPEVDFNKRTELDCDGKTTTEVNSNIRELMKEGYGTIVLQNPRGMHSLGVGILSKLNLIIEGSTGYFAVGLIDGPNVRINGRVGWSCGENMMSGTIMIEKNAGSTFGAAIRGGRPGLPRLGRIADRDRPEGRYDHRRWRHRCALGLHDAARPDGCLRQCRQEPGRQYV